MNKNLYRIVFNKARGLLMVVAENVLGSKKASGGAPVDPGSRPPMLLMTLHPLRFSLMAALGLVTLVSTPAWADIVADHGAPAGQQPGVGNAANGVPQVNIQTPSAAGVSRNTYSQFDVNTQGAILNNSRNNVQTQLGGWIDGNQALAKGTARVILNEINSSNPSQLRGYVEVAGDRAQVVIANPAGIACDGCGFINSNRATLTTGTAQMQDGQLQGYRVEGGKVVISGKGLDAAQTDFTDVIARSVEVNAGIWAKDLRVTAGANQVNADNTQATVIAGIGEAPVMSVDVAQLGGMYAGKIKLVGTEAGMGVRNAGQIGTSAGDVVISADGRLGNSGRISSSQNLQLDSRVGIDNSGSLYSQGDASLTSRGDIQNQGLIAAQQNLTLNAARVVNAGKAVLGAGVAGDGIISGTGTLRISASQTVKNQGATLAAGDLQISAASLELAGSESAAQNISLNASSGDADLTGAVLDAGKTLSTSISKTLKTDGARLNAQSLQLAAHDLSNRKGQIIQVGQGDMAINLPGTLDNDEGRISSNGNTLSLSADTLSNRQGKVEHAGTGSLVIQTRTLSGNNGSLGSNGLLQLSMTDAVLDGASTLARQIQIDGVNLSNRQGQIIQTGHDALRINTLGQLDNSSGTLASDADITLVTGRLLNQGGTIQATGSGSLAITASGQLDNASGALVAAKGNRLSAGQLSNALGKITAGEMLTLSARQLNNDQGMVAAIGAIQITGDQLSNKLGTLGSVSAGVDINATQGPFDNTGGSVQALQAVNLYAKGVLNNDGLISGGDLHLDSVGQTLDNRHGVVLGTATVNLLSGELNNQAGLIQAGGELTVNTHHQALINTDSGTTNGILAQAGISLTTGQLINRAGFIGGKGDIAIDAGQIDNSAAGVLTTERSLRLSGSGLDNRGGQIQTLGNARLDLGSGRVDNAAGLLRAGASLTLTSAVLDNQLTQGTDQGIEGSSVLLDAAQIVNRSGAVRADETLTINSSGQLDNAQGLVSSSKRLLIGDPGSSKQLAIANDGGKLIAGEQLAIDAASLAGNGQILSIGDISLALTTHFINTGKLLANGNVEMNLAGMLDNQGSLQAGNLLHVWASSLENRGNAEISAAKVTLDASITLNNRGLIDAGITRINAAVLNNLGSGRIYGDQVSIAVQSLNNDVENGQAAVIAARNRLDIGAQSILNREHAMLFSVGDMAIGGTLDANGKATGQAALLHNASATIEALGDLSLSSAVLRNTNEHFSTQLVEVAREALKEFQLTGSATRYRSDQISTYDDEVRHLVTPEGLRDDWNLYDITRTTTETQILTSDPGQILSGGSMLLNAGTALNDKSRIIAGGTLTGNITQLDNTEVAGARTVTDSGSITHYYRIQRKGRDRQGYDVAAYDPAASVLDIFLHPTQYQQNTAPTGSGTQIGVYLPNDLSPPADGAHAASVNIANGHAPGPVLEVSALQSKNAEGVGESIRTGGIDPRVPDNSLFHINTQANPAYLVESDPRFTSYRSWLSSDYMLERLSLDPALTLTRLGDGFYEQKLIREQIAQLTGRRFLDGYANDETQYRALLDSALTYAGKWNLVPGVSLTSAQMAQLTSDIVWLVEKDVTLANGSVSRVLVPQVYVRVRDGDLDGSGALMAGNVIDLKLQGDLVNSGTIAGRSVLAISAQNIQNLGGRLSGGDVGVQARTDLNNLGGLIDAGSNLSVIAGRDLNVISSTGNTQSAQGTATQVSRVAGLFVSGANGALVATAGNNINLQAAQVVNSGKDGKTTLGAGNDINLGTLTDKREQNVRWNSSNWRTDVSRTEVGSSIQGEGDVRMIAGNDVTARGASVTSEQGGVLVSAGRDINLSASQSYNKVDEAHVVKGGNGLFSSKTTSTRDTLSETRSQGTTLSGETAWLKAGNDLNVQGSNVVSTGDTSLIAGHDVNVLSATDQLSEQHTKDVKQSGLFSGGGVAVTVGTQQQNVKNTSDTDSAAASSIGSTHGNVSIQAGNAYRQVGSQVSAPAGDINIQAQKADILEAQNQQSSTQESKFKQGGLTVTITNPVISAVQTAQQMKKASERTDDGRMKTLAAANALLETANAAAMVQQSPAQAGGINVSISIGGSKNENQSEQTGSTAAGSSVLAGGDVNITASGAGQDSDIRVQGSQISAGHDARLKADGDIALLAASNTVEQHSTNKGSSASIGIGFAVGGTQNGFTLNAGASMSRGKADGNDLVWSNTHVDAGNKVVLESGGDTRLKGAVVSGQQVMADVGGNLSIESLQDTSTFDSKQSSAGVGVSLCIPPFCYGASSASVSAGGGKQNSNFASVIEQTGIKAGDGGFDVRVKGNTDLVGGVLASSDKAIADGKNLLSTGSLTYSDLHNSSSASADSSGISLSTDMLTQGKYGAGKALVANALNAGQDSGSSDGDTRSAISAGDILITDGARQQQLTGRDASQTLAGLNRDTDNTHSAAERLDVEKMARTAEAEQTIKNEAYRQVVQFSDEAYRKMFIQKAQMFVVLTDEQGRALKDQNGVPLRRELTSEEKNNLQPGSDGKVHMANNGIFNDEDGAAKYANQHRAEGTSGPQYFIWFPVADNSFSELLIVGYQKFLENDFWGLSNATDSTRDVMLNYGRSGLHLDGHSRGTLTEGNALESIMQLPGGIGSLSNTSINFFGAAYSVDKADELLGQLQNRQAISDPSVRDSMTLQYQIHNYDPVGRLPFVGANPGTGGVIPEGSSVLKEVGKVFGGQFTVHNCYGDGSPAACRQFWTDFPSSKPEFVRVTPK